MPCLADRQRSVARLVVRRAAEGSLPSGRGGAHDRAIGGHDRDVEAGVDREVPGARQQRDAIGVHDNPLQRDTANQRRRIPRDHDDLAERVVDQVQVVVAPDRQTRAEAEVEPASHIGANHDRRQGGRVRLNQSAGLVQEKGPARGGVVRGPIEARADHIRWGDGPHHGARAVEDATLTAVKGEDGHLVTVVVVVACL